MRNFSLNGFKADKKFIIAVIITLICAIICGIVLFKLVTINIYFKEFASNYVYYVFNFKNSTLIFSHIITEIFYLYLFFVIGYFTKFKYLCLIFVFIPTSLISIIFCCVTVEICKCINKKYCFFVPLAFAVINTIILLLLVNVVFRVVIVIV